MQPRQNSRLPFSAIALGVATFTIGFSGCGGSKPESNRVDPPSQTALSDDPAVPPSTPTGPAKTLEAPGKMELPPDAVPGQTPTESKPSGGFEMPDDASLPTSQSSPAATNVSKLKFATWDEIRREATSVAKVTVVDLWSLSCEPCLKEFPELVRLHQTSGENVQCIAVNVDFDGRKSRPPQYYQEPVESFLQSVGAEGFTTYICSTPSDDVFAAAEIDSIPTVIVFDAKGQPVKVFVDAGETLGFTYQKDVLPLLQTLL